MNTAYNPAHNMTSTVSLRLTAEERAVLEAIAAREQRTLSNYVRKLLRKSLAEQKGRDA